MSLIKSNRQKAKAESSGAKAVCNVEIRRPESGIRIARVFFAFAMICGLLITFVLPPLCAPDENVHFVNAYCMSRLDLFPDEYEGALVHWIPSYVNDYINFYPVSLNGLTNENSYRYPEMYHDSYNMDAEPDETPKMFSQANFTIGYAVSAASMAIGTWVSRIFDFKEAYLPYNQIMFGRIGNLLFYVIVTCLALLRAPHHRKTILLIAMMPMSLFLGASLSYDAMVIPVTLYFVAIVLDLSVEPEKVISLGDIIRILLCVFAISGIKFGAYIPLLILLLTVPRTKYGSVRRMIGCIVAVVVAAIAGYLPIALQSAHQARLDAATGFISNSAAQKEWLMSNLGYLPKLFAETIRIKKGVYMTSFWGKLGWLDTLVPAPIMYLGYLVLIVVGIHESCTSLIWKNKRWKNLLAFVGGMTSVIGVMMGMYFAFSPVGNSCIEGVQGRYFIPVALVMGLAVSNGLFLKIPAISGDAFEDRLESVAVIWAEFCAVLTVLILLGRYWIR